MTLSGILRIVIVLGFALLLFGVRGQERWVKPCLVAAFLLACAHYVLEAWLHAHPEIAARHMEWRLWWRLERSCLDIPIGMLLVLLASGKMMPQKKGAPVEPVR